MARVELENWKVVFKGKTFTVEQRKGYFPDKTTKLFERVLRSPTIEIFAFNKKKELLLNKEYKMQANSFVWRAPTGGVRNNEKPINAAKRELMEEAGYKPKELVLYKKTLPTTSFIHTHYVYFARSLFPKKIVIEEDKDIQSKFFKIKDAYKMVKKGEIFGTETKQTICELYWTKDKIDNYFK